jgi:hypothetical protein
LFVIQTGPPGLNQGLRESIQFLWKFYFGERRVTRTSGRVQALDQQGLTSLRMTRTSGRVQTLDQQVLTFLISLQTWKRLPHRTSPRGRVVVRKLTFPSLNSITPGSEQCGNTRHVKISKPKPHSISHILHSFSDPFGHEISLAPPVPPDFASGVPSSMT